NRSWNSAGAPKNSKIHGLIMAAESRSLQPASSVQRHRQRLQAAQGEGRAAHRRAGEFNAAEIVDQRPKGDLAFHAGQREAEAVMDAAAEGDMAARVAGDVELVRL